MGFGYVESVYERCLLIELDRAGLQAQSQLPLDVQYEGVVVGEFIVDILVENQIVVELKSVRTLVQAHEVQLVNYLTALDKPVGLLLNFGPRSVEIKRKHRSFLSGKGSA
jgi:GxxExxY protein